jgi:hypothetical protein
MFCCHYSFGFEESCVVVDLHVQYAIGFSLWHRMLLRVRVLEKDNAYIVHHDDDGWNKQPYQHILKLFVVVYHLLCTTSFDV